MTEDTASHSLRLTNDDQVNVYLHMIHVYIWLKHSALYISYELTLYYYVKCAIIKKNSVKPNKMSKQLSYID